MEIARNTVVAFGFDHLLMEVVAAALSSRGWRVVDSAMRSLSEGVMEIALVSSSGSVESVIASLRRARAEFPAARVVLFGVQGADADFLRFVEEGMKAWVAPSQGLKDLDDTLLQVLLNRTLTSGRVTQLVLNNIGRLSGQRLGGAENQLTPREEEILLLIGDGLSNKEIAVRLCITPNTVKNHVHHLLEKLQVRSRYEAYWIRTRVRRALPMGTIRKQGA
jgi:two-component system, NarL family, nitrate/nitrite response regulator NarL